MERDPKSHKTQNGTVAVVGGSSVFHGAPIFSALAAEASGVDLVYPVIHASHAIVTRSASLNFIVSTFTGESLRARDASAILLLLRELHACVLGPGLAETQQNEKVLVTIVKQAPCALVLDAGALRPRVLEAVGAGRSTILTPHLGELERLTGESLTHVPRGRIIKLAVKLAREHCAIVLLKGHEDFIVSPTGKTHTVHGGNAGLTKGGTGDALAGLIAGLIAQGVEPFEACVMGARVLKRAATLLFPEKGFGYTTREVIAAFPHLLHIYHLRR